MTGFEEAARAAAHAAHPSLSDADVDQALSRVHDRLAALPLLTGEELDELGEAVGGLLRHLLISTPAPQLAMSSGLQHRIAVLNSLANAIAETRGALR